MCENEDSLSILLLQAVLNPLSAVDLLSANQSICSRRRRIQENNTLPNRDEFTLLRGPSCLFPSHSDFENFCGRPINQLALACFLSCCQAGGWIDNWFPPSVYTHSSLGRLPWPALTYEPAEPTPTLSFSLAHTCAWRN